MMDKPPESPSFDAVMDAELAWLEQVIAALRAQMTQPADNDDFDAAFDAKLAALPKDS